MSDKIKTTAEAAENAALPEAYAVHTRAEKPTAEQQPLPKGVSQKPVEQKSPAEWAYERIVLYIKNFEEQLDSDHEVGMGFAGSEAGTIRIQGMGYFAPDLITFYGTGPCGWQNAAGSACQPTVGYADCSAQGKRRRRGKPYRLSTGG